MGRGPMNDALDGVDTLIKRGIADPDRMGVVGHSLGGYYTSMMITMTDRFKAACNHVGGPGSLIDLSLNTISGQKDFPSTLKVNTGDFDRFGPPSDPKELEIMIRESPVFHVNSKVKTPALLEYGGMDPYTEPLGVPMYRMLQYFDVPSELVVYPKEGHGFNDLRTRIESYGRQIEWLNYWVRGIPTERMVSRYGPPKNAEIRATAAKSQQK